MSDKSTKEVVVDGLVKVGISLFVIKIVKDAFMPAPGRTDRVKFDYPATQVKKIYLPGDPNKWYEQPDPWEPNDLARRLHTSMNGVTNVIAHWPSDRYVPWGDLANLGIERTKWLHNYWLDKIDREETLYRWIKGEYPRPSETDKYTAALSMLQRAGVNF